MCGIAGIINFHKKETRQGSPLLAMARRMRHRGPDDEGYTLFQADGSVTSCFGDDTPLDGRNGNRMQIQGFPGQHIKAISDKTSCVALGHRRLSIVDLSIQGHQPMATPDQRFWIVYNGEVYNHTEIARDLAGEGVVLQSSSDTEVILKSYVLWGPSCLDRFNGMFAFAIWDNREKTLFCARDRIGIKPFYYTMINEQFIFASDIKTIIASGLYTPEPDMEGLYLAMAFGIAPRPKTAFKNIQTLEQAHWLKLHVASGKVEKHRYWSIPVGTQDHGMSEDDAVQLLEERLTEAIKYRLVADVPVGTFMSGGIDSTTISAIASRLHPGIKAFTLAYESNAPEFDEVEQARATAAMHPMQHIVETVRPESTLAYLNDWVAGYEEPFYHLAANYVISKIVKDNNVTVVLNGLGGDELFAGYGNYRWAKYFPWFKQLARLSRVARFLEPFAGNRRVARALNLLNITSPDRLHTASFVKTTDCELHRLFPQSELKKINTIDYLNTLYVDQSLQFEDAVEAMSYMDIMNYIGNHHVHRVDQFTMAHSIEGRFPFLDHKLIEAAFTIPSKYKIQGKVQKYVLRKVAEKYIAPQCLSMQKKGFGLPLRQWMNGPLSGLVKEKLDLLKGRKMLNKKYIEKIMQRYENDSYSATHTWHLVMLELWFEYFMEGNYDAGKII